MKRVSPPGNTKSNDVGHMRKVKSYEVEAAFYKTLSGDLITKKNIAIPRALLVEEAKTAKGKNGAGLTLVMNDLRVDYPITPPDELVEGQIEAGLKWLARFHAAFWEAKTPEYVWEQGGYWHLRTRMDEWESMGAFVCCVCMCCVCLFIYMCVYVCTYICICACMYVRMHVCMYTYTYTRMHTEQ